MVSAAAATVYVTWPQALVMSAMAAAHHDVEFSIWRLQWIAHALVTSPSHLFDPPIFHPAAHALAYSDATLLQGFVAAPFLWMGAPPLLVYNALLLAGFAGSGVAMFVLVRHLTGAEGPAVVASTVFVMAPYRIEHFMHLELQWAMFIPLTFWALHRAVDEASVRFGVFAGAFVALQFLSCVYYGMFLAMTLVVFVPLLMMCGGAGARSSGVLQALALGGLVALVVVVPYALPYRQSADELGVRDPSEIARYSAHLSNYLATSSLNAVWGWTSDRFGDAELRLFPGVTALVLAVFAFWRRPVRSVLIYAVVAVLAIELSFGLNGAIYRWLAEEVTALQGFRALARFGMILAFAVAVLSGLGTAALLSLISLRRRPLTLLLLIGLLAIEYRNHSMVLSTGDPQRPPDVYQMLRRAPAGTLIELPVPRLDRLPGWEPYYQGWQVWHWRPLVNGYSGYYPRDYLETLVHMLSFPDPGSIERLRGHDVRFIVIHRSLYDQPRYTDLMLRIARRSELKPWGTYKGPVGLADIFELLPVE
jgi:hypothetical protein